VALGTVIGGLALDFIAFPKNAVPGQVHPDVIFNLGLFQGRRHLSSAYWRFHSFLNTLYRERTTYRLFRNWNAVELFKAIR